MKVFLIFLAFCHTMAFAQLKLCFGSFCGTVENANAIMGNIDYVGGVGDVAAKAWEGFQRMLTSAPGPTSASTVSLSPQSENGKKAINPYDIVVKFTSIEEFIANGSQIEIADDLRPKLLSSSSLRDFDLDTFAGSILVVNGMFKQGKSWFCQRLSGLTNAFLSGFDFATHGFSIKRVDLLGMKAALVDVQGYGFPVKVLSSTSLINQQILEEITHKVSNQICDAFIQVINAFSQEAQKLMMLNAAQALALDHLASIIGRKVGETLSIIVHNVRDKPISELVGHVRHNVMGRLPNHQCIKMTSVPNLESEIAKLRSIPGFNEKVCGDLKMGEFYMTSAINGKTTFHFFLAAEGDTSGAFKSEAVLMNDIALTQLRNNLRIGLVDRENQRRGVLVPIIEGIKNVIPDYLINTTSPSSTTCNTSTADGTALANQACEASNSPSTSSPSVNAVPMLVALEGKMMVRPKLYEVIPMAKLPLPTPVAPYRVYHVMGKKKSNGKLEVRNIIVEVDLAGYNINRTEFERDVGKLSITLHRDPFYLNHTDSHEVYSDLVFGSTTKQIQLDTFSLESEDQLSNSTCPSNDGFVRIILKNNCCKFEEAEEVTCETVKKYLSRTQKAADERSRETSFYTLLQYFFGWNQARN